MEVKRKWRKMVKPWHPTPDHLKTVKLSVMDQMASPCHIPSIFFFFSASSDSDSDYSDSVIRMMEASLSKALCEFYPLAGRFQDDSTLICNDEGVLLIHAQITCSLKSYFSLFLKSIQHSNYDQHQDDDDDDDEPLLRKLLPPHDSLYSCGSHQNGPVPISSWLQFAVQVSIFECGGVAIGSYGCHKLLDGTSASTFLRHWAGLNLGVGPENLVKPDFDSIVATFPPFHDSEWATKKEILRDKWLEEVLAGEATSTLVVKPFVFKPTAIAAIREMAASSEHGIPSPTRTESVVAFLWKHCLEAENHLEDQVGRPTATELVLTVDMRSRTRPPLPRESMGNLATNVVARAQTVVLAELVAEIRGAITHFKEEKIREFQDREKGREALWEHVQMITRASSGNAHSTYRVSCQNQAGYMDLDFGFGKPAWVSILDGVMLPVLRNLIILMDHTDDEGPGFEVWLILDKKQMQRLETNPHFLAFASIFNLS